MRKRNIFAVVLSLVLLLSFVGIAAEAAGFVDTEQTASLMLTYGYDGQTFSDISIHIYQVAKISRYADFTLAGEFSQLPVEVNNVKTQEEWKQVASTLSAFAVSEGIASDWEAVTDENGVVSFADLPLGLYLVESVRVEQEKGYCQFDSFVISVPNLDENDSRVYDVAAKPKSVYREVLPQEVTYTVNKLWKDEGHEHLRPRSVSVDLYRDGDKVETVTLSAENNWTYSWTAVDDGAVWQAVESDVPEGYKVTLEQKGNFFFVTNGYNDPTDPPKTGDISNIQMYLLLMCAAGLGLVVLGIAGRRGKMA